MTFNELLEKTKSLDLKSIGVYLGRQSNKIETISLWEENGEWILQEIDDKQKAFTKKGKEEDMCRKMFGNIKLRME